MGVALDLASGRGWQGLEECAGGSRKSCAGIIRKNVMACEGWKESEKKLMQTLLVTQGQKA